MDSAVGVQWGTRAAQVVTARCSQRGARVIRYWLQGTEVLDVTNYRQVGGRLGAHFRGANPSTQQIQGLLADLLAGDDLLLPMRDVIARPLFQALQPLAGSGAGDLQRDSLIQDLSARYHPAVVESIRSFLDGFLDLNRQDPSLNQRTDSHTDPIKLSNIKHPSISNQFKPTQELSVSADTADCNHSTSALTGHPDSEAKHRVIVATISAAAFAILIAIAAGLSRNSSPNDAPVESLNNQGVDSEKTPAGSTVENSLTEVSGEITYPGTGIPAVRICAVEVTTRHEICKQMPESSNVYEYRLSVPPGTYNLFYETTDRRMRFWSGACSDVGNLCDDFIVGKIVAGSDFASVRADIGKVEGLANLQTPDPDKRFIF